MNQQPMSESQAVKTRPRRSARYWPVVREAAQLLLIAVSIASAPASLLADDGLAALRGFIADLETFEADFEQTLYSGDDEVVRVSTGSIKVKRPGRFVWQYAEPEPQVIVADGERIWLYDVDLEQVTVNAIDDRVAGTPLQLLMRSGDLDKSFEMTSLGMADGVNWTELKPVEESSDFELVFIGLNEQGLAAMELRDNFGQATQIIFSNFEAGLVLDDSLFVFEVPEGVDVIGLDE